MRRRGAPRRLRRARYPPAGLRQRGPVADRLHRWLRQSPQGAPAHRRSGGCRGSRGAHIVYTFGDCCGHHQRRLGAGTPSDGAGHCGLRGAVHVPAQQHLLRERHGDAHDGARDRDHRDVYPRRPPRTRGPGTTTRERQRPFSARRGTKGHEGARRRTKGHEGAIYELGSPTTYGYADGAAEISRASSRDVTHIEVSEEQAQVAM